MSRTEGRFVFYTVELARMNEVLGYLTENCCGGAACEISSRTAALLVRPKRAA